MQRLRNFPYRNFCSSFSFAFKPLPGETVSESGSNSPHFLKDFKFSAEESLISDKNLSPQAILNILQKGVVGQEKAKKVY